MNRQAINSELNEDLISDEEFGTIDSQTKLLPTNAGTANGNNIMGYKEWVISKLNIGKTCVFASLFLPTIINIFIQVIFYI